MQPTARSKNQNGGAENVASSSEGSADKGGADDGVIKSRRIARDCTGLEWLIAIAGGRHTQQPLRVRARRGGERSRVGDRKSTSTTIDRGPLRRGPVDKYARLGPGPRAGHSKAERGRSVKFEKSREGSKEAAERR